MREFDNELDRVRNEIEYLRSEDKNRKVKQEKDKVSRAVLHFVMIIALFSLLVCTFILGWLNHVNPFNR